MPIRDRQARHRRGDRRGMVVWLHVPAVDHDETGIGKRGREAAPVRWGYELVTVALDDDRGYVDRAEAAVDLGDDAVRGEALARPREEVAVGHVDREHAATV